MEQEKIELPKKLHNYKDIIESTTSPFIKIKTSNEHVLSLTSSRIGGIPYWPDGIEYPYVYDKKAKLIAQINFSELAEKGIFLNNYPTSGILQFFCPETDYMLGLVCDDNGNCLFHTKVVYHEDLSLPALDCKEIVDVSLNNTNMPFDQELGIDFCLQEEWLALSDEYSVRTKYKDLNIYDHPEVSDFFYEEIDNAGSKIGGYAYFTQNDPRSTLNDEDEWILLLQIDSDDHIMIGDCGVANWFIKKEDLLKKDFSNVLFNWDCC